jgi:iron complex outermembrane receptor protein
VQIIDGVSGYSGSTVELRFNGRVLDGRLDWTAGAFNYHSTATLAQMGTFPAFSGTALMNDSRHRVDNANQSVYVHTVYRETDRLSFTGGVRYSRDRRDFHFNEFARHIFSDVAADGNSTDFRFGADYELRDATLLYGSVATGYKPSAFNPRPFQESQLVPVGGERLVAYELGLKSELLDGRLRANLAAFFSDYRKRIVSRGGVECLKSPDGTIIAGDAVADPEHAGARCAGIISRTSYTNVPARIRGLELETEYHPIERLSVTASGGLTDFIAADLARGNDAPYVPKYNATIGLAYDLNLPGGGTVRPRADYYLQSKICYARSASGVNPSSACAAGYFQLDARVDYTAAAGLWSAGLGVTNVTAERFYYNILDLTIYGQPTTEGQPSRPREWYLSVSRYFH